LVEADRPVGYCFDDERWPDGISAEHNGFRATARTILAERLDVAAELVEAQLAHAVSDSLGRAYNRARLLEQRRQMMTTWANYLDKLRTGFQAAPIAPPALVRMFTHAEELARNKDEPESK